MIMKSLCITGSTQNFLRKIAAHVDLAGAKPALSSRREPEINLSEWHGKVMSTLSTQKNSNKNNRKISRVWEQLAGDIFYNNHQEKLWYWDEERSLSLLDFWADFDPNIYFIIVHTPLELALQMAFENEKISVEKIKLVIKDWMTKTEAILNFKNLNSIRCEIVDIYEYCISPKTYLDSLSTKWNLSLDLTKAMATEPAVVPELDISYYYLSSNLANEYPHLMRLKGGILSDKLQGNATTKENLSTNTIAFMLAHEKKQLSFIEEKQKVKDLEKAHPVCSDDSFKQLLDLQDLFEDLSSKYKVILKKNEQYKTDSKENVKTENSLKDNYRLANKESLLIIHNMQELLESNILKLRAASQIQTEYKDLVTLIAAQNLKSWLVLNLSIEKHFVSTTKQRSRLDCRLENCFIAGRVIPQINLQIHYTSEMAGIVFLRKDSESSAPLQYWPQEFRNSLELKCIPANGSPYEDTNTAISALGTSDWIFIKALTRILLECLEDQRFPFEEISESTRIIKGLSAFEEILKNWPLMLRCDTIEVYDKIHDGNYNALEFKAENLSLGETTWACLDYRLATIDMNKNELGKNSQLEFLSRTKESIQAWLPEIDEEGNGTRMKLRFAEPELMDIPAWNKFTDLDRLLITGLISDIPHRLKTTELLNYSEMDNWRAITFNMRAILKNSTKINSTSSKSSRIIVG